MIACTGWTWTYVEEELDLPMLIALNKYWRKHPPTHLLLAARYGFKPPGDVSANDPAEIEALMRMFHRVPPPPKATGNG